MVMVLSHIPTHSLDLASHRILSSISWVIEQIMAMMRVETIRVSATTIQHRLDQYSIVMPTILDDSFSQRLVLGAMDIDIAMM